MAESDKRPRILIPITRARSAAGVLEVAAAILRGERGSGLLLGVVELAQGRPVAEMVTIARRYRSPLQRMTELETQAGGRFPPAGGGGGKRGAGGGRGGPAERP